MADSKQATPDDKQNDIALFSAEHDFGNAKYFYAARTAIAELKRLLASRSGPEQATPECTCGDIYGGFPAGEPEPNQLDSTCPVHGNKLASRSGPDRTLSAKEFFRNDPRFRNTNTEPYTDVELAHVNTSINGTDVFEFAEAYASQAGPDRPEAVAPAPEQPADAKALMEICATCGHLRDSHIKLTRDGELRGACTVCNKCDSFVEPAQTTPGNVMYSCGHVAHDPNAPQDANWKAETACPDCSGPSEERARELTGVSQEAAKVDAFAVNQRIGHLFSEIRRHAGRTNFDEEDICELLRPYVEAKCQIESADLAAPSSEREDSSGPDRTTQEPREWLIAKRGAAGQWINKNTDAPIMWTHDEVLAYLAKAGPDRGQQDAPDWKERYDSLFRQNSELDGEVGRLKDAIQSEVMDLLNNAPDRIAHPEVNGTESVTNSDRRRKLRANEVVKFILRKRVQPNDVFFIDGAQVNVHELGAILKKLKITNGVMVGLSLRSGESVQSRVLVAESAVPDLAVAVRELLKAYQQLMPGIGALVIQDYDNINRAPLLAAQALKKAGLE